MREVGCDKFPTVSAASSSLLSLLLRLVLSLPILIDTDLHTGRRRFAASSRISRICNFITDKATYAHSHSRRSFEEISLIRVCRYRYAGVYYLCIIVTSCINVPIQCLIHILKQITRARDIRLKISVFIRRIEGCVGNLLRSYNSRASV